MMKIISVEEGAKAPRDEAEMRSYAMGYNEGVAMKKEMEDNSIASKIDRSLKKLGYLKNHKITSTSHILNPERNIVRNGMEYLYLLQVLAHMNADDAATTNKLRKIILKLTTGNKNRLASILSCQHVTDSDKDDFVYFRHNGKHPVTNPVLKCVHCQIKISSRIPTVEEFTKAIDKSFAEFMTTKEIEDCKRLYDKYHSFMHHINAVI